MLERDETFQLQGNPLSGGQKGEGFNSWHRSAREFAGGGLSSLVKRIAALLVGGV